MDDANIFSRKTGLCVWLPIDHRPNRKQCYSYDKLLPWAYDPFKNLQDSQQTPAVDYCGFTDINVIDRATPVP